jgi:hypothetical protein
VKDYDQSGRVQVGPPHRQLFSEIVLTILIYVGALAASMLVSLVLSFIPMALMRGNDEGALFMQPVITNCIALLVSPTLFATIAANHCRRTPVYFVVLTPVPGLLAIRCIQGGQALTTAFCAVSGLIMGYWILRLRTRRFRSETSPLATNS